MRGTEKQLKFAESLIIKFIKEMDTLINECPDHKKQQWISIKEKILYIFNRSYAGDVIHLLANNDKSGKEYYISFYSRLLPNADKMSIEIKKSVYGRI